MKSTVTDAQRATFLERLRQGDSLTAAARATGLSRKPFYRLRMKDPEFAGEMRDALTEGTETIEQIVVEIAKGERGCKYQPQLTACFAILKAREPHKWRDRYVPDPGTAADVRKSWDPDKLTEKELEAYLDLAIKTSLERLPGTAG